MRTAIIHLSILLCFFVSCKEQEQQARTPKQYSIEQLYNNLSVSAAGFNPDETSVLVDNNSTGIYNVYELNIGDTTMQPLTVSKKESFFAVDYLPGTSKFIYSSDVGGNENDHLYLMNKGDTTAKDLTDGPTARTVLPAGAQIKKQCT